MNSDVNFWLGQAFWYLLEQWKPCVIMRWVRQCKDMKQILVVYNKLKLGWRAGRPCWCVAERWVWWTSTVILWHTVHLNPYYMYQSPVSISIRRLFIKSYSQDIGRLNHHIAVKFETVRNTRDTDKLHSLEILHMLTTSHIIDIETGPRQSTTQQYIPR